MTCYLKLSRPVYKFCCIFYVIYANATAMAGDEPSPVKVGHPLGVAVGGCG